MPVAVEAPADRRAADRTPGVRRPDKAGSGSDTPESGGVEAFLPAELELADILPFTPSIGGQPAPDVPPPTGPAAEGEAVADYGRAAPSRWPMVAGMVVALAFLAFGGGALWWRNRDTRYWPA
jgi:hypothetical protein